MPDYKLAFELPDKKTSLTIPVETEEAQGWMSKFKEFTDQAIAICLIPVQRGFPPVRVALGNGKKWVYFRTVTGTLLGGETNARFTTHCIGWEKDGIFAIVRVYPNGSVELGERN